MFYVFTMVGDATVYAADLSVNPVIRFIATAVIAILLNIVRVSRQLFMYCADSIGMFIVFAWIGFTWRDTFFLPEIPESTFVFIASAGKGIFVELGIKIQFAFSV